MARLKQLSLFEEENPPSPPVFQPFHSEGTEIVVSNQASSDHVPRSQQKLEAERFTEFAAWLQRSLQPFLAKPLIVKRMYGKTRYVAMKQEGLEIVLRIHRRFIDAPDPVCEALVGWLKGPRRKPPKLITQYIHELSTLSAAEQRLRKPREDLPTLGKHYNLEELYRTVNDTFFGGTCKVAIGWGKKPVNRARSRHLGSYSAALHRISIHPLLDTPQVPEYVLSFVIYHELLHSIQPPGTHHPHDKAFRDAERMHPEYRKVKEWEKEAFSSVRC